MQRARNDPRAETVANERQRYVGPNTVGHGRHQQRFDVGAAELAASVGHRSATLIIAGPTPDDEPHGTASTRGENAKQAEAFLHGGVGRDVVAMYINDRSAARV